MKNISGFAVLLTLLTATALARPTTFEKAIEAAQKSCPSLQCQDSQIKAYPMQKYSVGNNWQKLENIAQQIADNVWPDTILESHFEAAFNLQLHQVEGIYEKNKFIGYRITYIDQAWDLNTCHYNRNAIETLKNCKSGWIKESSFVDKTLKYWFIDETRMARFHPTVD